MHELVDTAVLDDQIGATIRHLQNAAEGVRLLPLIVFLATIKFVNNRMPAEDLAYTAFSLHLSQSCRFSFSWDVEACATSDVGVCWIVN